VVALWPVCTIMCLGSNQVAEPFSPMVREFAVARGGPRLC